jgi:hypothetical protein
MTMKIEGLVFLASALGLVLAPACSASSGGSSPPAEAGAGGSSGGAVSGGSGGKGAPTEQQILCLGNFYCTPGTLCCANMATQSAACSTGPACPLGRLQVCMADSDCGGAACSPITVTGITLGICGFGGGSSGSGSGGSSGSSGGSSSGGGVDDGGDAAGDAAGDGSSAPDSDASPG